jgi:hypothetical protein
MTKNNSTLNITALESLKILKILLLDFITLIITKLISESPPTYDELLLNIDNLRNIAAIRKGDWKLVQGRQA